MGLMLGAEFNFPVKELRKSLAMEQQLMTGSAKHPNVLRLLPPLTISDEDINTFKIKIAKGMDAFKAVQLT